jgi:hypothetical protein
MHCLSGGSEFLARFGHDSHVHHWMRTNDLVLLWRAQRNFHCVDFPWMSSYKSKRWYLKASQLYRLVWSEMLALSASQHFFLFAVYIYIYISAVWMKTTHMMTWSQRSEIPSTNLNIWNFLLLFNFIAWLLFLFSVFFISIRLSLSNHISAYTLVALYN